MPDKPLCIDLFCGLGGWSEGFLSEGFDVLGFDITRHVYGEKRYPAQLVLQDVLTLHGSQFRNAAVIVASPPCQQYSWLAMPWSRSKDPNNSKAAKALRLKWETEGPDNRLFDACFRIQREAIEATRKPCDCFDEEPSCEVCYGTNSVTRYIPLIVENVRGAQPWVGRSAWNYGSFHLWADVPALMPYAGKDGTKIGGDWFSDPNSTCRKHGSKSKGRRSSTAGISKIPFEVARHIAQCYYPTGEICAKLASSGSEELSPSLQTMPPSRGITTRA